MKIYLSFLLAVLTCFNFYGQVNESYGEEAILKDFTVKYFAFEYIQLQDDMPFEHKMVFGLEDTLDLPFSIEINQIRFSKFVVSNSGISLISKGDRSSTMDFRNQLNLSVSEAATKSEITTNITLLSSGLSPHRVLKYQASSTLIGGNNSEVVRTWQNYQIWIYEDGIVQCFFGPSNPMLNDMELWQTADGFPFFGIDAIVKSPRGSAISRVNLLVHDSIMMEESNIVLPAIGWPSNGSMAQISNDSTLFVEPEYAELELSPNPVDNFFRLDGPEEMEWEFIIIDIAGREAMSGRIITNQEYPIYELRNGTYTLELYNEINGLRMASKLIVE